VRVFEDIATAGVIARNPQEKSQFRDPLLRMRGEMFRVVGASPTNFAAGRRERKRCVVTVPNALNYLVSFVEIGEVALGSRSADEKPDHWHRVLLRMCREQPSGR
jgi:hypothetical protein